MAHLPTRLRRCLPLLCSVLLFLPTHLHATEADTRPAPLFDDLGDYEVAITTKSPDAQRYFNQGMMLAWGFNHAEAVRSFRAAQALDPACAMCFWGEAFALGPNINKPMDPADAPAASAAAAKADELRESITPREQAYVDAMVKRYTAVAPGNRRPLDKAFSDAMGEVVDRFPDDLDAAAIHAEAMMNLMPWDYFTADGEPKPLTTAVISTLESILARNPDHAGAIHLYIHAVEASRTPERAEAGADRLGKLVPGSGHLVHMPSHIYLRVGRYHDATKANELAALADESYINQCRAQGFYPALYYPHNVHFLWYTASLEGRSGIAIPTARKLADQVPVDLIDDVPLIEQFLAVPQYGLIRFGRWDAVLAEPKPAPKLKFATAMWHAARGIAYAAKGDLENAHAEQRLFAGSASWFGADAFATYGYPAHELLTIARHLLAAGIASASDHVDQMIGEFHAAIEIEDALPYMEPPYWFFPNRQLLGYALLKRGRVAEAEAAFRDDLKKVPSNGWSLSGLIKSLTLQDKAHAAEALADALQQSWSRADVAVHPGDINYF